MNTKSDDQPSNAPKRLSRSEREAALMQLDNDAAPANDDHEPRRAFVEPGVDVDSRELQRSVDHLRHALDYRGPLAVKHSDLIRQLVSLTAIAAQRALGVQVRVGLSTKAAVEAEREACARLVDEQATRAAEECKHYWPGEEGYAACVDAQANLTSIATQIRARTTGAQ